MDWYETLKNTTWVVLILDIIINFSYYKGRTSDTNDGKSYQFKTVWHRRFNTFTTVLVIICAIAIVSHWIKALI